MFSFLKNYYACFPIVGMGIYLLLFLIAANNYPGGSINVQTMQGYSFLHNFLCDVMDPITKGGVYNPARGLAIVSHVVLSLTMIFFFYLLPEIFNHKNRNFHFVRFFGMFTMSLFVFMYTSYHDLIVTLTGIFGTIALIPFFIELRGYPNKLMKVLAYGCFALSIVVFFSFETKIGFYYLPFLQKITFLFDAVWVIWVSLIVLGKNQQTEVIAIPMR